MSNRLLLSPKWMKQHKWTFILTLTFIVIIVLLTSLFKGCTTLGNDAHRDVYVPSDSTGFMGKAHELLDYLVADCDSTIDPTNVQMLNQKYPALIFALPYDEWEMNEARTTDIRLIGIKPDSIRDKRLRQFFYNSMLSELLEKQRANMGQAIFKVKFTRRAGKLAVQSIRTSNSMFRLNLEKGNWVGSILANESSMIPDANHCYVVWMQNMIPLRRGNPVGEFKLVMNANDHKLRYINPEGRAFDFSYINWYYHNRNQVNKLEITVNDNASHTLTLSYPESDRIRVKVEDRSIVCYPYNAHGAMAPIYKSEAHSGGAECDFSSDLKLVICRNEPDSARVTEIVVSHRNPQAQLSTVVRTSQGQQRISADTAQTDRFTQQVIRAMGSSLQYTHHQGDVHLTLDPIMSRHLQGMLGRYCHQLRSDARFSGASHQTDEWELSLTVMDMATGHVLAAPYYRTTDERLPYDVALERKNPALTRRYIGSTFKPMLALAAVLTNNSLLQLDTRGKYHLGELADFYGYKLKPWAVKTPGHWNGRQGMTDFLAFSDDVYPVVLATYCLNGGNMNFGRSQMFEEYRNDIRFRRADQSPVHITSNPFIRNIDALYCVNSFDDYYYTAPGERIDAVLLDNVCPDITTMHYETFYQGNQLRGTLVPWVLGQGTNEWSTIKLAEAWTRMLTKRDVRATFLQSDSMPDAASLVPDIHQQRQGQQTNSSWNTFLGQLRTAQSLNAGLLYPMYRQVENLNAKEQLKGTNRELALYAKTGTPDNYDRIECRTLDGRRRWLDIGLYCMALMPQHSVSSVEQDHGGSGLMCVVRITRLTSQKPTNNGIGSADAHRLFSTENNYGNLRDLYHLGKKYLE